MPDIFKVDSSNIIGGPGRLVFKTYDGVFPDKISDVMDLAAPYDLKDGWKDLGATNGGITIGRSFDTTDTEVDQVQGPVDSDVSAWTHALSTDLAENTVANRQLVLAGGTIIDTPAVLGTGTTTSSAVAIGATLVGVTAVTGFTIGGFAQLSGKTYKIINISGTTLTVSPAIDSAIAISAPITPVTEPATRRIGYGTPSDIPFNMFALISQKKSGALYMAVFRKCKITGDNKEQSFGKDKRFLPLALAAYADSTIIGDDSVYFEIEQIL